MRCLCLCVTPLEQSINTLSFLIFIGAAPSADSSALPLPLARFESCLSWISFDALSKDAMMDEVSNVVSYDVFEILLWRKSGEPEAGSNTRGRYHPSFPWESVVTVLIRRDYTNTSIHLSTQSIAHRTPSSTSLRWHRPRSPNTGRKEPTPDVHATYARSARRDASCPTWTCPHLTSLCRSTRLVIGARS